MGRLLPLLLLACLALGVRSSEALVRGADPALAAHYEGKDGQFTCLDGSKTIPLDRVNDDYCDCLDGSDEPGAGSGTTPPDLGERGPSRARPPVAASGDGLLDRLCVT